MLRHSPLAAGGTVRPDTPTPGSGRVACADGRGDDAAAGRRGPGRPPRDDDAPTAAPTWCPAASRRRGRDPLHRGRRQAEVDRAPAADPQPRGEPRAALVVDHYADDWTELWWVRVDASARILGAGPEFERGPRPARGEVRAVPPRPPAGSGRRARRPDAGSACAVTRRRFRVTGGPAPHHGTPPDGREDRLDEDARHAPVGGPLRTGRDRPRRASAGAGRVGRRPAADRPAPAARRRVRLHRRRRRGRAHARREPGGLRVDLVPAARAARRREGRPGRRPCSAGRSRIPLVLAPTGLHPHRRSRRASSRSRGPRRAPSCRTRSRRSAPARSRRSARSATGGCGSRSTPGATAGSSPR